MPRWGINLSRGKMLEYKNLLPHYAGAKTNAGMDAVFHLVASSGRNGSQFPDCRLAGGLRVGSAVLDCEAVARCLRGSRADLLVEVLLVASRLKTLVHDACYRRVCRSASPSKPLATSATRYEVAALAAALAVAMW